MMMLRIAVSVCLFAFVGCNSGPSVAPVTGKVTLDGAPLPGAIVTFSPIKGGKGSAAVGTVDANGEYKLTDMNSKNIGSGAVAGDSNVGIVWFKPEANDTSRNSGESVAGTMSADKTSATATSGPKLALPVPYQNPETSGLKATVKSGQNTFDFALDGKFKGDAK